MYNCSSILIGCDMIRHIRMLFDVTEVCTNRSSPGQDGPRHEPERGRAARGQEDVHVLDSKTRRRLY